MSKSLNGLSKLRLALKEFFEVLEQTAPASSIRVLLMVADHEGQSMSAYARMAGMTTSSMSRALLDLGPRDRNMNRGYGLVRRQIDPKNKQKSQYFLSDKGKDVVIKAMKHVG